MSYSTPLYIWLLGIAGGRNASSPRATIFRNVISRFPRLSRGDGISGCPLCCNPVWPKLARRSVVPFLGSAPSLPESVFHATVLPFAFRRGGYNIALCPQGAMFKPDVCVQSIDKKRFTPGYVDAIMG